MPLVGSSSAPAVSKGGAGPYPLESGRRYRSELGSPLSSEANAAVILSGHLVQIDRNKGAPSRCSFRPPSTVADAPRFGRPRQSGRRSLAERRLGRRVPHGVPPPPSDASDSAARPERRRVRAGGAVVSWTACTGPRCG